MKNHPEHNFKTASITVRMEPGEKRRVAEAVGYVNPPKRLTVKNDYCGPISNWKRMMISRRGINCVTRVRDWKPPTNSPCAARTVGDGTLSR